tara:strand:+ start:5063 stop:5239 length:177 start_codon:yes stop_codon:yes gene_type:complete
MKTQISFEGIVGFNIGINYLQQVETPKENVFVDLIILSFGFFLINIALIDVRGIGEET